VPVWYLIIRIKKRDVTTHPFLIACLTSPYSWKTGTGWLYILCELSWV